MSDYSQARSFNLGIAVETSVEAALIYDDLAYAQKVFGEGYFYRSDEQMLLRFPIFSKNTIRRHVAKLVDAGWISTKVKKVEGRPVLHYQIEKVLLPKMGKSMEIPKMGKSIYKETKQPTNNSDSDSFGENSNSENATAARRTNLGGIMQLVNPREKVTDERLRMFNARLKDYSLEEIQKAAQVFSKSKWHIENKQMSIDNLLAPSKFGRWYAQIDQASVPTGANQRVPDFYEDEDGNKYFRGELITPENQDRITEERNKL